MAEADDLILSGLRELGCPGIDDSVLGFSDFDTNLNYDCIHFYLEKIDDDIASSFPETLPPQMAAKVNTCTNLALAILKLGFKGELAYSQLMYPTEEDIRQVLSFLSSVAPDGKSSISGQVVGGGSGLADSISEALQEALKGTWSPSFCETHHIFSDVYNLGTRNIKTPSKGRSLKTIPGLETYYSKHMLWTTEQPEEIQDVPPSIFETNNNAIFEAQERELEWNAKGLESGLNPMQYKEQKLKNILAQMSADMSQAHQESLRNSSKPKSTSEIEELYGASKGSVKNSWTRQQHLIHDQGDTGVALEPKAQETEEEKQAKQQSELEELQENLDNVTDAISNVGKKMAMLVDKVRQSESQLLDETTKKEKLTKEYKLKKATFDMLPKAVQHMKELRTISDASASRLVDLASEWEKHRAPLVEQYRQLQHDHKNENDESELKLVQIKEMRAKMKEIIGQIKAKDEEYKELLEEFSKLNKDTNRAIYTKRILEIVKNVKKQKVDIEKILDDTRNLQKEINSVTETLGRVFALTDELIFQDAKKDPTAKQAYKDLVAMNDNFTQLTETITETGSIKTNILNLQTKIDRLTTRTESYNIKQVASDLKEIKTENASIIKQIKAARE